jgi:two-component system sensor histidine kinase PhcS
MSEANFHSVYEDEKRRDYIARATLGTAICIPLNLLCPFMDHAMYPDKAALFFKARLISILATGLGWFWFKTKTGRAHPRFGVMWFLSPQLMILWMFYSADDRFGIYYAGLNIVMLGIGVLTPWERVQNLLFCIFTLVVYVVISLAAKHPQPFPFIMNNATFLFLTAALVACASFASARQRLREFTLRYELDKNRRALEISLAQLKENEAQLVHSEKLSSLGRMSAGMIHEINNPLNFAKAGLGFLHEKEKFLVPEQRADFADILKDVEAGVNRVNTIVSDLRMFTHPDTEQRDEVSVGGIITAASRFLNNECADKVEFEEALAPGLTVFANKNKLIHVFTNLLQNSLDALKNKKFTDEKPVVRISGRAENGTAIMTVYDNGPGIAAENLGKIYDPFFTTKDVGEGMGLGLSICYRIVREAGGKISVKTEPGRFCEFTVELPVREKTAATN